MTTAQLQQLREIEATQITLYRRLAANPDRFREISAQLIALTMLTLMPTSKPFPKRLLDTRAADTAKRKHRRLLVTGIFNRVEANRTTSD